MIAVYTILVVVELFMLIRSLIVGKTWPWVLALALTTVVIAATV